MMKMEIIKTLCGVPVYLQEIFDFKESIYFIYKANNEVEKCEDEVSFVQVNLEDTKNVGNSYCTLIITV